MPHWLLPPGSSVVIVVAAWTTLVTLMLVIVLFVFTVSLRLRMLLQRRRRAALETVWRDILAATVLSREEAESLALPRCPRGMRDDLLEIWNRMRATIRGSAADHLIVLGERLGLVEHALQLLDRRDVRHRILAIQTLGHMRHRESWSTIRTLVDSDNMAISIVSATALAEINRTESARVLVPMIVRRRDWPRTQVSRFLRSIGSARIAGVYRSCIEESSDEDVLYLLQFAQLVEHPVVDSIAESLVRQSGNPEILSAALKLLTDIEDLGRVRMLARHERWFVRMQVARLLGRAGMPEDVSLLEEMLDDPEWWVRYRAAQSIARLPFLGPNALRKLRERQQDEFAQDMLEQAFAEVGVA